MRRIVSCMILANCNTLVSIIKVFAFMTNELTIVQRMHFNWLCDALLLLLVLKVSVCDAGGCVYMRDYWLFWSDKILYCHSVVRSSTDIHWMLILFNMLTLRPDTRPQIRRWLVVGWRYALPRHLEKTLQCMWVSTSTQHIFGKSSLLSLWSVCSMALSQNALLSCSQFERIML